MVTLPAALALSAMPVFVARPLMPAMGALVAALCTEAEAEPARKPKDNAAEEEEAEREGASGSSRVVAASATADGDGGVPGPDDEIDFAALIPDFGTELGLGILAGFSSGYAVKKIGKLAALTVGLGFVAMQVARHYGVLKPEHMPDLSKLDKAIKASLDVDGDGKVTSKDINKLANRGFKMLSANVPAASGFGVAFLLGLNYG